MTIIVAPDSFKGSLSAEQAIAAVTAGIRRVSKKIKVLSVPLADGGEGTAAALAAAVGGSFISVPVTGPLGTPVTACFAVLRGAKTVVIDMAAAAGLPLVPEGKRNPLFTTTFGVGELIRHALETGCREIILGAGGSATVDGGVGMLQALGAGFFDERGKPIGRGGRALARIRSITRDGLPLELSRARFRVAADVTNPLCGAIGAARVYGPQKGADGAAVAELDRGLRHFAKLVRRATGVDLLSLVGGGAAGGLAAGAAAFLGADIVSGAGLVLDRAGFEAKLVNADLVITGEGMVDAQTGFGKAPAAVARLCAKHNVPLVCLAGRVAPEAAALYALGVSALFSIADGPCAVAEAVSGASRLLERAAENVVRLFLAGK
jgi:glycerate 2-kinase